MLLLIVTLVLALLMLTTHHVVLLGMPDSRRGKSGMHDNSKSVEEQTRHIKLLLSETTALLRDVMQSNITLSPEMRRDAARLSTERIGAQAEMQQLHRVVGAEEEKVVKCVSDKHQVIKELQRCQQSSSYSSSSSSSSRSSNVGSSKTSSRSVVVSAHGGGEGEAFPLAPAIPPRWLVIGIPTIARAHNEDYLLTSLQVRG
jgi:hypothetical protein